MATTKEDVNLISATGTASSSTFLRGDGAWQGAGGGWEFVGQSDGAATALVSFENMTTGYDYLYTITNAVPVSDNQKFNCLFGVAGITYRTADYRGFTGGRHDGGSTDQGEFSSAIHMGANPQGSDTNEKSNYELTIYDPSASGTITSFGGFAFGHSNTGDEIGCYIVGGFHNVAEAIVAVKWSYASGNIESGLFRQYKRANA